MNLLKQSIQMNNLLSPHCYDYERLAPQYNVLKVDDYISLITLNLQYLLNTRIRMFTSVNNQLVDNMLFNYGIKDFSQLNPESEHDQRVLCQHIEQVIRINEPRITQVKVMITDGIPDNKFEIHFIISALLTIKQQSINVLFNSVFSILHATFSINGDIYNG